MSASNRKAAARKMKLRYRPGKRRSVADAIAAERRAAQRATSIVRKKK